MLSPSTLILSILLASLVIFQTQAVPVPQADITASSLDQGSPWPNSTSVANPVKRVVNAVPLEQRASGKITGIFSKKKPGTSAMSGIFGKKKKPAGLSVGTSVGGSQATKPPNDGLGPPSPQKPSSVLLQPLSPETEAAAKDSRVSDSELSFDSLEPFTAARPGSPSSTSS